MKLGDGLNLYAYCANNPVIYYDPSGQVECKKETTQNIQEDTPAKKADFIVTPNGTVMDTSKDYNLVSTTTPTNKGGEYFQIHNNHSHEDINGPHTHRPEVHTDPDTGRSSSNRVANPLEAVDIDFADAAIKDGRLRERNNIKDKGGY